MTEPATQAGRAHVEKGKTNDFTFAEIVADVIAIEAEAVKPWRDWPSTSSRT